jgi:hypothetical protein
VADDLARGRREDEDQEEEADQVVQEQDALCQAGSGNQGGTGSCVRHQVLCCAFVSCAALDIISRNLECCMLTGPATVVAELPEGQGYEEEEACGLHDRCVMCNVRTCLHILTSCLLIASADMHAAVAIDICLQCFCAAHHKTSMFSVPDNGKVGVTGSGKPMTEYKPAGRHDFAGMR